MGLFKKVIGLLFEEDNEVIVEDDLEKVDFSAVKADDISDLIQERKIEQIRPIAPVVVENKPEIMQDIKAEPMKSIDIQVEPKRKIVEPMIERRVKPTESKKEFDFTPVISPMFGSKNNSKSASVQVEHEIPTAKRRNPLGTVISPMYGQNELDAFEDEAQTYLEEKKHQPVIVEDEETLDNIELEDLIVNSQDINEEDCIQFSLFGDDTAITEINKNIEDEQE